MVRANEGKTFTVNQEQPPEEAQETLHELREMHWRLASIIEGTHVGTWEWNVQTGETVFNELWAQIIGYTLDELAPISIKTWETFSHPDDLKQSAELLERHFAGELPYYDYECRMKHKDGHWIWVHDRGRVITRTDDDKPLMMFGTHTDITERKRQEEALRESEKQYRTLFEAIADTVFLIDQETGSLLDVNTAATRMYGFNREEFLRMTTTDVSAEPEKTARATSEPVPFIPLRYHRHKNGSVFPVEITASPFELRGRNTIIATARDITERTKLYEKLRDSEIRFHQLADSTWEGILIHRDGIILDGNKSLFDMLGYVKADVLGRNILDFIPPEFTEKVSQVLKRGAEPSALHFEGKGRKKDGTVFPIEALGRPITHDNLPARVIAIRDLTQQKQAEADKEKLEAQNRQLQKSESLSRMAGAIAHHFNNKLGVVMGNLEMAMDKLPQGTGPVENLSAAMQAAGKATEVSSLMLTYIGQTSHNREPLDLSEACLRSMSILQAVMPGTVVLETDFPSPGPVISANANQIQQVMTNLITNAWEAVGAGQGSIHLSVKTVSPADIPQSLRFPIDWQPQDHAYACLKVADTGGGIAHNDIEKLFDPFFSSKFTGRGLGLSVVMGIVMAHGGVITVESEPERGSTFRVFFPVTAEELPRQLGKASQSVAIDGGGTILLVEDEEMVRKMAKAMLTRLGFTVLEAKDGVEAVEVFRKRHERIRFVLCDLTMPRMNGWETLTALRKLAPGIPVILTSGYDKDHVMAGDHPELPQAFLGKPYGIKGLSDAISQALNNP